MSHIEKLVKTENLWKSTIIILSALFFLVIILVVASYPRMFFKKHGRIHAILGLSYLIILICGFFDTFSYDLFENKLLYFVTLGVLGILLPLSAAQEFGHKNVKNSGSGTLDEHATVTYSEMIEHSFYQVLNLCQVIFLHKVASQQTFTRFTYLALVTAPWLLRSYFPINHFSDNYTKLDPKSTLLIRLLYRIKKYQYVFYKHFLFHGLNISVTIYGYSLASDMHFRIYWMLLNTSYTMEFFLQTLVKKSYMRQTWMIWLQKILMLASSMAAMPVLAYVDVRIAIFSICLNFANRGYDVVNTFVVSVIAMWVGKYLQKDTHVGIGGTV
jgi:hypothetical protein